MTQRHCILILGMHRSGTSAVAELVSDFGLDFGRELLGANEWNPHGHFESLPVIRLNDAMLAAGSAHWHTLLPSLPDTRELLDRFGAQASSLLEMEFAGQGSIAIKDPRLCRLLPFWVNLLQEAGYRLGYLFVVRDPQACAQSLERRDRFDALKSHWLWGLHLLESLGLAEPTASLLMHYESLIARPDEGRDRIRSWLAGLGIEIRQLSEPASTRVDAGLSHASRSSPGWPLPGFVARLYRELRDPGALDRLPGWLPEVEAQRVADLQSDLPRLLACVEREVERKDRAFIGYEQEIGAARRTIDALTDEIDAARRTIDDLVAEIDRAREAHAERDRREARLLERISELECQGAHG